MIMTYQEKIKCHPDVVDYCSYDQLCQFSVLSGSFWQSYLENLTIDDKFINK